jgi:hypothetical protein
VVLDDGFQRRRRLVEHVCWRLDDGDAQAKPKSWYETTPAASHLARHALFVGAMRPAAAWKSTHVLTTDAIIVELRDVDAHTTVGLAIRAAQPDPR